MKKENNSCDDFEAVLQFATTIIRRIKILRCLNEEKQLIEPATVGKWEVDAKFKAHL